ncbi:MAG: SHOCT-like domain-containing protein [Acholeplasmataceae bacterium]
MSRDQLKEERLKILDLLAKGIISSDQAEKLLAAIDVKNSFEGIELPKKKAPFRMLKILIESNDGDNVRVQIPIEFAKLLKTGKFNVNLKQADLDIDQLLEMIHSGASGELVNIQSADGDNIKIVVE